MSSKLALILRDWSYIRCRPDLIIVGKSGQYKCHRIVILCLSPYFQKLFLYSRQTADGFHRMDMSDIECRTLLSIINFAYRSVLDINDDNVEELMICADKYNIMSIMNRCQQFLRSSLDSDNCIDVYLLAHFYNCPQLKSATKQFIIDHKVIPTDKQGSDLTDQLVIEEWHKRRDN